MSLAPPLLIERHTLAAVDPRAAVGIPAGISRGQQCGQPERTSSDPARSLAANCADTTATHSAHAIQPCAAVMVLSECCAHLAKRRIVRSTDQLVRCSCVALAEACSSLTSRGWLAELKELGGGGMEGGRHGGA